MDRYTEQLLERIALLEHKVEFLLHHTHGLPIVGTYKDNQFPLKTKEPDAQGNPEV